MKKLRRKRAVIRLAVVLIAVAILGTLGTDIHALNMAVRCFLLAGLASLLIEQENALTAEIRAKRKAVTATNNHRNSYQLALDKN